MQRLTRLIQKVADQTSAPDAQTVSTGWRPVDQALAGGDESAAGGLRVGAVHEFFPAGSTGVPPVSAGPHRRDACATQSDSAPLCLLAHLARQAAQTIEGEIIWIGRRCWPNPQLLARTGLLGRSLLVEAPPGGERLWAIDLAMRSPAGAVVVGDAAGFKIPATRRLELAGRECRALVLLARPAADRGLPSAATTRWLVQRRLSDSTHPAWTLELLHCKGRQLAPPENRGPWTLEWDDEQNAVVVPAALVDRAFGTTGVSPVPAVRSVG